MVASLRVLLACLSTRLNLPWLVKLDIKKSLKDGSSMNPPNSVTTASLVVKNGDGF